MTETSVVEAPADEVAAKEPKFWHFYCCKPMVGSVAYCGRVSEGDRPAVFKKPVYKAEDCTMCVTEHQAWLAAPLSMGVHHPTCRNSKSPRD